MATKSSQTLSHLICYPIFVAYMDQINLIMCIYTAAIRFIIEYDE